MTLFGFALGNLTRRPARSLLTVSAIAIGTAAVVALTGISWGFEDSWQRANDARGTDLIVTRLASENTLPSAFLEEEPRKVLSTLPHVQAVVGLLSTLLSVSETAPPVFVFGWAHRSYLWDHLRLVEGAWPASDTERVVMVGTTAATVLGRRTGDTLDIEGTPFRVAGIFESTALMENGALILTLTEAQKVTDRPGKVNVLNVKLDAGASEADLVALREGVRSSLPGFAAITSAELVRSNAIVRISKAMSNATMLVASLVSVLVVFNSMLMSISERTREIGVLLALGWRRRTILELVCGESALLSLAGGAVGIVLGMAMTAGLEQLDLMRGKIDPVFSAPFLAAVLALSMVVGVLGGLYPGLKAAKLRPAQALRQE